LKVTLYAVTLPSELRTALDPFLSPEVAAVIGGGSLVMLVVSLVAIPWLLCRLPEGYLVDEPLSERHGIAKRVLRNVLGGVLVFLGVLMLVLPGQGLLTIFVGLTLLDFPKKREWIKRVLSRPRLLKVINSMRERFGHSPLRVEPELRRVSHVE
jgi:UPF0716 family protein affecting phage T7 exclusion